MSTVVTDNVKDSGGSSLLGRRNAIINGNFGVNQRVVSGTVTLSAGDYGHDRWKAGASGATYTFSTSGGVTTLDISAGSLIQVVEDVNVVTDTYVLSWEGTAQGKIGAGSFGDSGLTESVTGGSNLNIEFGTGAVSKVQLEVGNKPTPFEHRSIGEELALCHRYFQKSYKTDDAPASVTDVGTYNFRSIGTVDGRTVFFSNSMRSLPTVTIYNPNTGSTGTVRNGSRSTNDSASVDEIGNVTFAIFTSGHTSSTDAILFHWTADAEL